MNSFDPLPPEKLYTVCDADQFDFETTAEMPESDDVVGQERAVAAIRFGISMKSKGYNLFALGPEGTGKQTLIGRFVAKAATECDVPDDWVYVNNFVDSHKPRALSLPPGRARPFAAAMDRLVEDLVQAIPSAFDSEEYRTRKQVVEDHFKARHESVFGDFQERMAKNDIAVIRTPMGLGLAPTKDGEVLGPDEFKALPDDDRKKWADHLEAGQKELEELLRRLPRLEKEHREEMRELNRNFTANVVEHLIDHMIKEHEDLSEVVAFLGQVRDDVVDSAHEFLPADSNPMMAPPQSDDHGTKFRRYRVNVMVDNGPGSDSSETEAGTCAPVVFEDHPTQPNLLGRIEHLSQMGTLVTDFNLIKPGALHRANGGYLVLHARRLLMQPFAYEALKRTLRSGTIRIESAAESYGLASTVSLEPQPIPVQVKVILTGNRQLYYMLNQLDPEFKDLFKVAADFDDHMDRSEDNNLSYAQLLRRIIAEEELRPLHRRAVARIVEHGARLTGDSEKITSHMTSLADLVREADFWAGEAKATVIAADHVQQAIDSQIYRADRIKELMQEQIERGTLVVETAGEQVGQINGLAVYQMDHFSFGKPSRISCRVRLGRGEVIDIEREVALGGPLHSKGVLILSSYMATTFAQEGPLSLSASLVFEQSYGGVDGDSASSTELYALLSALSDLPIRQSYAVTGSVDQNGRVQAIGGVNEKIEGFFDLCKARGLDGTHGVLIPRANVKHLMLRREVVEAAGRGLFHIHPVDHVDQGIEILTGVSAGRKSDAGEWPLGSVNRAVAHRLSRLTEQARRLANGERRHGPSRPSRRKEEDK